ncbi:cell division protein ZapA [Bacteroidetes bacterium UKL13-3]|nr:cell division protein ZapA [Bacteroidetes bacterium UKL13-3]HCP94400.1 cell division protein ZapA [Bacteroidota bacterium]
MDELSIKVNIADRFYPLSVNAEQEEQVRKAAKLINDKLKAYEKQFSVKDKQDILSMCALELATELIQLRSKPLIEDNGLSKELAEIQHLLKQVQL